MEEKDYYFICFIILVIAFIVILVFALIFNVDQFNRDIAFNNQTTTTYKTTSYTKKHTTHTTSEVHLKATVSTITKLNSTRDYQIEYANNTDNNYYISNNGYREIKLKFDEDIENFELLNFETSCIIAKQINSKTWSFSSSSCKNTSTITLVAKKDNTSKQYTIHNEDILKLYYEEEELKKNMNFDTKLLEFTSNIDVEWVTSNNNGLIYTDTSNRNIQFKLIDNLTIKAISKGGQEIEIVFK